LCFVREWERLRTRATAPGEQLKAQSRAPGREEFSLQGAAVARFCLEKRVNGHILTVNFRELTTYCPVFCLFIHRSPLS
jgi:hypothetical protein